jgi:hypothetical protein
MTCWFCGAACTETINLESLCGTFSVLPQRWAEQPVGTPWHTCAPWPPSAEALGAAGHRALMKIYAEGLDSA